MWIWILLGIILAVLLLVVIILSLPVDILIKNDEKNNINFRFKFLFKTFGENPDPNNPVVKTLKEVSGISHLDKKNLTTSVKKQGMSDTVAQTCRVIIDLLKEVATALKHCKAKRFNIRIVCSEEDAADTAVSYGRCCAVVYPIVGYLGCYMKIPKRARNIDISCDYSGQGEAFFYDFVIRIKVLFVLIAFLRIVINEAVRTFNKRREEEAEAMRRAAGKKRPPNQKGVGGKGQSSKNSKTSR